MLLILPFRWQMKFWICPYIRWRFERGGLGSFDDKPVISSHRLINCYTLSYRITFDLWSQRVIVSRMCGRTFPCFLYGITLTRLLHVSMMTTDPKFIYWGLWVFPHVIKNHYNCCLLWRNKVRGKENILRGKKYVFPLWKVKNHCSCCLLWRNQVRGKEKTCIWVSCDERLKTKSEKSTRLGYTW